MAKFFKKKENGNGTKKEKKGKLQEMFFEDADLLDDALNMTNRAITAFFSGEAENAAKWARDMIKIEAEQDDLRDAIIQRLFGNESMVFSRPDRMRLITAMDRIVGQAKKTCLDIQIYTPKFVPELIGHLLYISSKVAEIGTRTKKLVYALFDDFDEAITLCVQINTARHAVRDRKQEFFKHLYNNPPGSPDFRFYAEFMILMTEIVNRMEHFADYIFGIVNKYSHF
jgi:uncharacterized protein Yka (UPF0111/DUF47 family)